MALSSITDGQLRAAVTTLADRACVLFAIRRVVQADPPHRGCPVLLGRGLAQVQLPGEPGLRDLRPHETEALLALALSGDVRLHVPVTPAIGPSRRHVPPSLRLEGGELVRPGDSRYPRHALLTGGGAP